MADAEMQWTSPQPLWATISSMRQSFRQPAILRFATDSFMNDFLALLQSDPGSLPGYRARFEMWREPWAALPVDMAFEKLPAFARRLSRSRLASLRLAGTPLVGSSGGAAGQASNGGAAMGQVSKDRPPKLYQPAHQRYYLVAACLVCRVPGQPDCHIETSRQERASFVVRRIVPPQDKTAAESTDQDWDEFAFVAGADGFSWQKISRGQPGLVQGEEQIPLFAVNYTQDDGRRRRLLAGLIPVGKRETYVGAPRRDAGDQHALVIPLDALPVPDRRTVLARSQVIEPWRNLVIRASETRKILTTPSNPAPSDEDKTKLLKVARGQLQSVSWLILLDLADYLEKHLPRVWQAITGTPPQGLSGDEQSLVDAIKKTTYTDALKDALTKGSAYTKDNVRASLDLALKDIGGFGPGLDKVTQPYDRDELTSDWPPFLFPLADPEIPSAWDKDAVLGEIDQFLDLITKALPASPAHVTPPLPLAAQPVLGIESDAWFVIRCVFERPNCGPLSPDVVSDPTDAFQMAGFFDPDAPARPIRIALPIDTTPAGLRKFDKNTAFMISDILCGQIERAKGLGLGDLVRSVLPWPLHKDLDVPDTGPCPGTPGQSLGMICSLSLPIITICALLLLMIIVNLLDIIFRWVPFFILCFPLPNFSGKAKT